MQAPPIPLVPLDEARALILKHAFRPRSVRIVLEEAHGRVLARDVRADRDVPPFDRSALDGFAVRLAEGQRTGEAGPGFVMVARIVAGEPWRGTLLPGTAASITTGSPVPAGADRIVPVERATIDGTGRLIVNGDSVSATGSRGIAPRGEDARKGDLLISAGTRLAAQDIAVLASVGVVNVPVFPRPRAEILTTGDEVIEPHERPRWHQIRNGNGPLLRALLGSSGWVDSVSARRVADRPERLVRRIDAARGGVIVLTGGVSMGERDFVPDALREAGFRIHLHRIAIRPGKPFLFATRGRGPATQVAFGLPGNPVSALVTAWELLLPFLRASAGALDPGPAAVSAVAAEAIERPSGLTHFVPVRFEGSDGAGVGVPEAGHEGAAESHPRRRVRTVVFHGSGDYIAMGKADGLAVLPAARPEVPEGGQVVVHVLGDEPRLRGRPGQGSQVAKES